MKSKEAFWGGRGSLGSARVAGDVTLRAAAGASALTRWNKGAQASQEERRLRKSAYYPVGRHANQAAKKGRRRS